MLPASVRLVGFVLMAEAGLAAVPPALAQTNPDPSGGPQPSGFAPTGPSGISRSSQVVPEGPAKPAGTATEPVLTFKYGKRQTFRALGVPQRWANIIGNVSDPDGISTLTYTLNGGLPGTLSIGPDTRRLQDTGDFNIDISWSRLAPLPDSNRVIVTATDPLANVKRDTVIVRFQPGTSWPLPYNVAWSTTSSVTDSAQVVDGDWIRTAGGLRAVQIGYDRLVAIGDTTWTDYEIRVPIIVHSVDASGYTPTSGRPSVGLLTRWIGHTDSPISGWQPKSGWSPSGALGMYAYNTVPNGGERLEIWQKAYDTSGKKLQLGVAYYFKMRVRTQSGNTFYGLRVWEAGQVEPSTWDVTWTDTQQLAQRGSFLLLAHHVDATFGAVTVVPDTMLPLPIELASFTALSVARGGVRLSWRTLSELNNYGFEIERSAGTPGPFALLDGSFVPGSGTTLVPQEYTFTDTTVTPGTWYYRLKQIDLDGTVHYHEPVEVTVDIVASAGTGDVPVRWTLEQNYPNPFNPSTTIGYTLAERARVSLTVWNVLGQQVATPVQEVQGPGVQSVRFEAAGLAGGMYIYRLQAGPFVESRTMMLVR